MLILYASPLCIPRVKFATSKQRKKRSIWVDGFSPESFIFLSRRNEERGGIECITRKSPRFRMNMRGGVTIIPTIVESLFSILRVKPR